MLKSLHHGRRIGSNINLQKSFYILRRDWHRHVILGPLSNSYKHSHAALDVMFSQQSLFRLGYSEFWYRVFWPVNTKPQRFILPPIPGLKIEGACSPTTLVTTYKTTRYQNLEHSYMSCYAGDNINKNCKSLFNICSKFFIAQPTNNYIICRAVSSGI
jgi:hypothetical protein